MLKTREDLKAFRALCQKAVKAEPRKILVCAGTGCIAGGSLDVYAKLKEVMAAKGLNCSVQMEVEAGIPDVALKKSGCQGFCDMGTLLRIEPQGWIYTKVKPADCEEIIEKTILKGEHIGRLAYHHEGRACKCAAEIPFYAKQTRVTMARCGEIDANYIEEYIAAGGYEALEKALFEMDSDRIIREITESNLRGRGGGGFQTGKKWSQVARQKETVRYVVCNGDEGDPGAFMDCGVMEGIPHQMLEGMIIAGYATGASEGYIYVRAEYPRAVERLRGAIAQAEAKGLLGDNILGSGFSFRLRINRGAGAFVCGEGSALTASIEGKRGMPRVKPPRTVEQGLFGKPTVLNNVETFAAVPLIIEKGAQWYRSIGTETSPGTKAFSLTGNIRNTGMIEVPMGTPLKEVIFGVGGGMREGATFKAVQIGGPSGACLTNDHMDLPLDFDSLKKVGAMIGSGGLVVLDENTCMVEVARFFMNFTQKESCGKCAPCREGTRRMLEILERIVAGEGRDGDLEMLEELADTITATALCGLGKTAASPVISTIRSFRSEYEAHIYEKRCPAGSCQKLKRITIDPELCKGCSKCAKVCPVGAISGKVKEPFVIDGNTCIKCGACLTTCPFQAIKEA
ncbi:MAG: NADH-quinone oxidoreductase subunit NuoF [Deltaproteobacteria bacterium]|jgi:NADH-quinone oxidoreductase subunit F|nr:NADH-quinone oxidoreductase subunit NuoF [Deltaproteobacteria bacterium]